MRPFGGERALVTRAMETMVAPLLGRTARLPMTCRPVRRRSLLFLLLSALVFLFTSTTSATGQAVYGRLRGKINDASGDVLPGVSVTITSKERNTSDTVVTDADGVYRKERL